MLAKELKKKLAIIKACTPRQVAPQVYINDGWVQPLMVDDVLSRFKWGDTAGISGVVELARLQAVIGAMVEVNVSGLDCTADTFAVFDKNGMSFDIPMSQQEGFVFGGVEWSDKVHEIGRLPEYLQDCAPYVAKDRLRPVMEGIYVGKDVVSSDGHLLRKIELGNELPAMILPMIAAKAIDGCDTLCVGSRGCIPFAKFAGEDLEVEIRCIEGRYPNYNSVIPTTFSVEAETTAKALKDVYKIAALKDEEYMYIGENSSGVKEEMTGMCSYLRFNSNGCTLNTIPVAPGDFPGLAIKLSTKYLKNVIDGLQGKVTICANDGARPFVFKDEKGIILIMPIAI